MTQLGHGSRRTALTTEVTRPVQNSSGMKNSACQFCVCKPVCDRDHGEHPVRRGDSQENSRPLKTNPTPALRVQTLRVREPNPTQRLATAVTD